MHEAVSLPTVEARPRTRRSTFIADHLKSMISSGHLNPGDRLPTEEKLCTHFGVSRTTLRESIQMLRASGILEVTPGRGSFVRVPNLDLMMNDLSFAGQFADICKREIYDILRLLTSEVVTQACDAAASGKKELHKFVIERDAGHEVNEKLERLWLKQIALLSGRDMTARLIESFLGMKSQLRQEMMKDNDNILRVMQMQLRINAAIKAGDKESALRLMKGYMRTRTA
mgnify:CR=1 FL=1